MGENLTDTTLNRPDSASSLRITRASLVLISAFFLTIALILYVWWPLAEEVLAYIDWEGEWWRYFDWLLVGIFLYMSILIVLGADLRRDLLIIFTGAVGGLVIESWGTQTLIWTYYTQERPPLWIIPAWPIASLTIDRMLRIMERIIPQRFSRVVKTAYWAVFAGFMILMVEFVYPTADKPFTWMAFILCLALIITPTDHRTALLIFLAGSALGYFLELWGTTRQCWTYYTLETPPLFAVFAHGMAAVAFWRAGLVVRQVLLKTSTVLRQKRLKFLF